MGWEGAKSYLGEKAWSFINHFNILWVHHTILFGARALYQSFLCLRDDLRARIFKLLRRPRIDSKETIQPGWEAQSPYF
jgi:hypothetical protein